VDDHAFSLKGRTNSQRVPYGSPGPFLIALVGAISKSKAESCRRRRGNSSSVSAD
jgi:hypothetical protein